ncbi:MAG TPA: protein kinase [Polyangia bacterium]|nr:protein kinase [Polyangia bacterium]
MERSTSTVIDSLIDPGPIPVATNGIPANFGKYEVITHLASGGMADIFLSRARGIEGFEKLAVIKRIRQDRAFDKKMVDLFLDEARLAASLQHPNIVQVFEFGIVEGSYFLAMEYVHGEDVASVLKRMREMRTAIPIAEVLSIVVGVCQGLHYAHECVGHNGKHLGVVHRDVSPSNVLISYDGAVMITDFGIAKATGRSTQTTTGAVRGKLSYMSPEQCRGLTLDRRSDIFAIGTLLHELSTGKTLFNGTSDFEVMKRIVEDPIRPPSTEVPGYPNELDRIVLKALGRDPERRYATAREMQLDLEKFALEHKLPISSARLATFMQLEFADRIAAWRQARAARARPPSAEVEIIDTAPTTRDESLSRRAPTRRRSGPVAAALVALGVVIAAQRYFAASRSAVAAPPAQIASTASPPPVPQPSAAQEPPSFRLAEPMAAPTRFAATTPSPATRPVATSRPIAMSRHRHAHRHEAHKVTRQAATSQPAHELDRAAPANWNPEDGLPPGTSH